MVAKAIFCEKVHFYVWNLGYKGMYSNAWLCLLNAISISSNSHTL